MPENCCKSVLKGEGILNCWNSTCLFVIGRYEKWGLGGTMYNVAYIYINIRNYIPTPATNQSSVISYFLKAKLYRFNRA